MKDKKVSAIIPAYNSERFIRDAVESALRQTHPCHEIIVVDDGSTDGTADILKEYAKTGRIIYYYQENNGTASARNAGVSHSTGDYLAFLDADDIWHDDNVERQLACLRANPDAGLVFCDEYQLQPAGEPVRMPPKLNKEEDVVEKLLSGCFMTPSTVMVKKEVMSTVGLFNTDIIYNEDWEFFLRAAMKFRMAYQPEFLVTRRNHPDSKTSGYYYVAYDFLDVYLSIRTSLDKKHARVFRAQNVKRCWKSVVWLVERGHYRAGLTVSLETARRHPPFILKFPAILRKGIGVRLRQLSQKVEGR